MSKYLKKYQKAGSVVPLKDYVFNGPLKGKCVGEGCLEIATNFFNKVTGANKYDYFPMQDSWFFRSAALKNGDEIIYDPGKGKSLTKKELPAVPQDFLNQFQNFDVVLMERGKSHKGESSKVKGFTQKDNDDADHTGVIVNTPDGPKIYHGYSGKYQISGIDPDGSVTLNTDHANLNYRIKSVVRSNKVKNYPTNVQQSINPKDLIVSPEKVKEITTAAQNADKNWVKNYFKLLNSEDIKRVSATFGVSPEEVMEAYKYGAGTINNETGSYNNFSLGSKEILASLAHNIGSKKDSPSKGAFRMKFDDLITDKSINQAFKDLGVDINDAKSSRKNSLTKNDVMGYLANYFVNRQRLINKHMKTYNPETQTITNDNIPLNYAAILAHNSPTTNLQKLDRNVTRQSLLASGDKTYSNAVLEFLEKEGINTALLPKVRELQKKYRLDIPSEEPVLIKGKVLPKKEKGGVQDILGYKDISPYRFRPYNLIHSGNITMDGVSIPLIAINNNKVHYLPPNSGNYKFKGDKTLEIPLYAGGGMWDEITQAQKLQDEENPQNKIEPSISTPKPVKIPVETNFNLTGKTPATTPFSNTVNKLQREDMVNSMSLQPKRDLRFNIEEAIKNGPKLEKVKPATYSPVEEKNMSLGLSGLSESVTGLQQIALGLSRKIEDDRQKKDVRKKLIESNFNPTFSYAENDYGAEYKKGGLVKYPNGGEQDEEDFDAYDFLFNDSSKEIDETIEQNNTQIEENALEEATKEAQEENDREQANLLDEVMSWKKGNMEGEEPTIYPNFSSKRSMRRANDGEYGELNLASGRVQPLSLSDNKIAQALQYRNYAMSLGLSKQEASGLIGNAIAESGLNPTILGTVDNKGSRGLFQPHSSRLDALKQRAQNMKADWRNPFMQINQAVHELNTTHKKARGNFYTATQASDAIMNHFEKPSKAAKAQSRNKRAGYAEMLMQFQKGGTYNLSHKEIKDLINKGYKIEVV